MAGQFLISVVFYDQIGNSRSTHLPSKPGLLISSSTNSSTVSSTYTSRKGSIFSVIHGAGSRSRVRWHEELCHLVLTNSLADMGTSTGEPSKALPDDVQKGLVVGVADMKACGKALMIRAGVLDEPVKQSIGRYFRCNTDVHRRAAYMKCLDRVHVPTFVINGWADTAQDFVVKPLFR
ncbi:hypothetical protein EDD85DRAFT_961958 [Armillaria nabsnona]|nr:hypothetical protein EDD85DRAFT_961958 [Armillaria nabsnona]